MFGQVALELKKQPWLLHVAALIGMLLLFAVPLGHSLGLLSVRYTYAGGEKFPDYVANTRDGVVADLRRARAAAELQAAANLKAWPAADTRATLQLLKALRAPLERGDYLTVNRLTLAAIEKQPLIVKQYVLQRVVNDTSAGSAALNADAMAASLTYYVKHRIDSLQLIDAKVSAVAAVQGVFAKYGEHVYKWYYDGPKKYVFYRLNAGTALVWVFLTYVVLATGMVFNYDRRHGTENLGRMAPRADAGLALLRGGVTFGLIALVLAATVVLALLINARVPGHTLGPLGYPLITTVGPKIIVTPAWLYVGRQLVLLLLWVPLIEGAAYLLSQLIANPVLLIALCSLTFLALPLHLLDLLPTDAWRFFAAMYTNPAAHAAQADYFRAVSLGMGNAVVAAWAALLWALGVLLQRLRYRSRGPWLS